MNLLYALWVCIVALATTVMLCLIFNAPNKGDESLSNLDRCYLSGGEQGDNCCNIASNIPKCVNLTLNISNQEISAPMFMLNPNITWEEIPSFIEVYGDNIEEIYIHYPILNITYVCRAGFCYKEKEKVEKG
jgi:hypothetical protein